MRRPPLPPIAIQAGLRALSCAAALLLAGACADSAPQPASTQAPALRTVPASQPARLPALWKVADEDTTIYLFGTVHVLPKGETWFEGPLASAFAASDTLVTEIVQPDQQAMAAIFLDKASLPAGRTLRADMTEADRKAYEAALAGFGLPPAAFDRFEPWYAAIVLSTLPLMRQGFNPENGVDAQLAARARSVGKPQEGLETADFQIGLFDGLPEPVQRKYLAEVVGQIPALSAQIGEMVRAWREGRAEDLATMLNADESDPMLMETLLTGRNRTWAGWIVRRLDRPGTVFVAVGAGHLAGRGSVQDQLAARGIAAARVE